MGKRQWSNKEQQPAPPMFRGGENSTRREKQIFIPPTSPRKPDWRSRSSPTSSPDSFPCMKVCSFQEIYGTCDVAYLAYEPQKLSMKKLSKNKLG